MKKTLIALCLIAPAFALAQAVPATPATPAQPASSVAVTTNPTPGVRQLDGTGPHGKAAQGKRATPRKSNCPQGQPVNCPYKSTKAAAPAK